MTRRRRWLAILAGGLLAWLALLRWGNDLAIALESKAPSISHGTPADGRLEHGKRLPSRGDNFRAYSDLGALLGRNAVHHGVRQAVLDAYASLATSHPGVRFVYAETGWPSGGRFRPHRTHRNGMAVDFHVPVLDGEGHPAEVPTHAGNRWGYDLEFDAQGRLGDLHIDFGAMAAHLLALDAAARDRGLGVDVVIFDPPLQRLLFEAPGGAELRRRVRFSTRPAWVRHDEHYHVVFAPLRRER